MLISTLAAFDHCTKADQATQENRSSRTDTFIVQVPPLAQSAFQERTTAYLVRTIVLRSAFYIHHDPWAYRKRFTILHARSISMLVVALQDISIGAPK